MRGVVAALAVLLVAGVLGAVYARYHDSLWNDGPVISVFRAADSPDKENSVGLTSQVKALFPDGTALSKVETSLAADGFICSPAREEGEMDCRRKPFGLFCAETWFVFYAPEGETARITHASKSLKCV